MTDKKFNHFEENIERAVQDAAMAALNLNFALRNYKRAGGEMDAVSRRLLEDTERFLNHEGVRV